MVKKVLIAGRGALALLAAAALLGSILPGSILPGSILPGGVLCAAEAAAATSAAAQTVEAHLTAADGRTAEDGTVLLQQGQSISAEIALASAGAMQIGIGCRIPAEQKRATVVQLTVGDAEPTTHTLYPGYRYAGQIGRDERGNDILPKTRRDGEMRFVPLRRDGYLAGERYTVDLPAGTTPVRLTVTEGELELGMLCAFTEEQAAAYVPPTDRNGGGTAVTIEAEQPSAVSSAVLLPVADRTSAATSPGEIGVTRLNTIGGTSWSTPGQWIEWQIPVEQAGWYAVALRVRQNTARGMQSLRRIRIDGRVPCAQLERYGFAYRRDWQAETLGDEDGPFWFWLDAGVHTLTMEVCMGDTAAIYDDLKATIARLNDLYLNIIKVTGTSPDLYRTYDLDTAILSLNGELSAIAEGLETLRARYSAQSGTSGSELFALSETAALLRRYLRDSDKIITTLDTLSSDISTVSTLLTTLSSHPLQIDRIELVPRGSECTLPGEGSLWLRLRSGVLRFLDSFSSDYGRISDGGGDRQIDVWISSGRDQAAILKTMIDDTFTPDTGIGVRLSLVTSGLVEAVMAGRGPDVALGVARTYPMDLGARGVLTDLTGFDGFDALRQRFSAAAFSAYTYKGRVFGLPETQDYPVMFVRRDVLSRLGLDVPQTWDEMTALVYRLSQEHMTVGVPIATIGTRLVQNGMTYYNDGFTSTTLSSETAYAVYADFIRMYREYEQPYAYNAANRFKTGEMPLVVDNLSLYSTITVLAPELDGQWDICPIPGVRRDDGTVDRSSDATGTAAVLLRDSGDPEAGFAFLDWWTGDGAQERFGTALEDRLGRSGRYLTANRTAAAQLPWSAAELAAVERQRESTRDIPEIPGSYIVSRNLTNIFYAVIGGANVRRSLLRYSRIIDAELESKSVEMALLEDDGSAKGGADR